MSATSSSPPWHMIVEFIGLDLDDDDVVETLAVDPSMHIELSSTEGVTTAEAVIDVEAIEMAFGELVRIVGAAAPNAVLLRLVDPLVAISDIAAEADVTRQAVRNWALGTRQSGFPRPVAIVGNGIRVWRHADVDQWLKAAVNLGSGHRYPPAAFVAVLNDHLLTDRGLEEGHRHDDAGWTDAYSLKEVQNSLADVQPTRAHEPGRVSTGAPSRR